MDESGGRGQPRSGNDESAERHAGPAAPAADPARPDPGPTEPAPADEQPPGAVRFASAQPESERSAHPTGTPDDAARPASERPDDNAGSTGRSAQGADAADGGGSGAAGRRSSAAPADEADHRRPGGSAVGGAAPHPAGSGDSPPAGDTARAVDGRQDRTAGQGRGEDQEERTGKSLGGRPDPGARARRPVGSTAGHHDRTLAHSGTEQNPGPRSPEPRGGLLMGRPFGVPVYVAPSWFLVAALITWVFGGQLDRVLPELGALRYLVSLFFAVAFYASVLVHELAHTVAALRFGLPVRRIQLQFFGGVSEIEKEAETPGREFVLAFVGPLLSLALAGGFYLAMQAVEPGTVPGVLLAGLMISNLIVAAFNLLPGLPLDGGRMLRAVVWKLTGKPMTGTIAAAWVGRALAVSVLIGLPLLTQSGALGSDAVDSVGMDTVLDALLAAILAAIIWTGAGNSLRMARLREHLPELRARTLTRRAVPVESDTPLSEALRRANAAGARALVVVDAEGRPLSIVREAAIVGVPEHRRPWVAVSGLAQELTDGMRVSAELAGEELLDALRATPATEYLVVEETGEIYGVLSAADVERAFVKAMARPS
ncbi:site-2 protease family protein [Streptomyces bullii]|uniref:Site-2 protease family protein n=1 Tax=Streptomyces bullii TaxID=349910 RepID=A0ABW0UZH8_9ACTN